MRIVFMGTADFAVPSLNILLEHNFGIVGVVTAPDKPAGRGLQLTGSPIKQFAVEHNLPIFQPERLRQYEFVEQMSSLRPDLFVIVAFRILPLEILQIPIRGAFNLHASLLPKFRGAAPIQWAVISGEKETGVTTFFLNEQVDTGKIILQARLPIAPDETAGELHDRLAAVGAEIVLHSVRLIENGAVQPRGQDNTSASVAPKIFKHHCKIDWNRPATDVHNLIRGMSPRPGAFTSHGDKILKIYRSKLVPGPLKQVPGTILQADSHLVIATGDGAIELVEVQQEGKKKLSIHEFLRGYRLTSGDVLA
jgi:methionyl-tRNA formyltransferase